MVAETKIFVSVPERGLRTALTKLAVIIGREEFERWMHWSRGRGRELPLRGGRTHEQQILMDWYAEACRVVGLDPEQLIAL